MIGVLRDPIADLQPSVAALIQNEHPGTGIALNAEVAPSVRWRPHVLEVAVPRGWYIHAEPPESDSWAARALVAQQQEPSLKIGVATRLATFLDPEFLAQCDDLEASVILLREKRGKLVADEIFGSLADLICEKRLKLGEELAEALLDRALSRALKEPDDQRKGVLLEVLCALVMSQVDGFETRSKGVSNRSQQMDVLIHSKIASGALGGSPVVLVEAKNWPKTPVSPDEYAIFERKVRTRHQRCKLGFIITTGRFTSGVGDERRRDSRDEPLIVLVDGKKLPKIWRSSRSITEELEELVLDALIGD
jgi:hypothetical protein